MRNSWSASAARIGLLSTTSPRSCWTRSTPIGAPSSWRRRSSSACPARSVTRCSSASGRASSFPSWKEADLFLSPLDEHGEWYRYHSVFREFLYRELTLRSPERVPELRRRASEWLAGEGLLDDAVHQALAAHEYGDAARIVSTNWLTLADPRTQATLLEWIDEFPKDVLRADASLCITRAWLLCLAGDHSRALRAVRDALAAEWSGPLPDGAASVDAAANLVRASFVGGSAFRAAASGASRPRARGRRRPSLADDGTGDPRPGVLLRRSSARGEVARGESSGRR